MEEEQQAAFLQSYQMIEELLSLVLKTYMIIEEKQQSVLVQTNMMIVSPSYGKLIFVQCRKRPSMIEAKLFMKEEQQSALVQSYQTIEEKQESALAQSRRWPIDCARTADINDQMKIIRNPHLLI